MDWWDMLAAFAWGIFCGQAIILSWQSLVSRPSRRMSPQALRRINQMCHDDIRREAMAKAFRNN